MTTGKITDLILFVIFQNGKRSDIKMINNPELLSF